MHFGYLYPTRNSRLASGWQPQELSTGGMPRSQWGRRGPGAGGFGRGWGGSGEERRHPADLRRRRSQEVSGGVVCGASGSGSVGRLVGRTGLEPVTLCLKAPVLCDCVTQSIPWPERPSDALFHSGPHCALRYSRPRYGERPSQVMAWRTTVHQPVSPGMRRPSPLRPSGLSQHGWASRMGARCASPHELNLDAVAI